MLWDKDPRLVEVVLRESKRVVRQVGPVLITETHHGFVCANSGVDQSSSGAPGRVVCSRSIPTVRLADAGPIRRARRRCGGHHQRHVRAGWREGQTDVAIGVAGIAPLTSYIGQVDPHGHEFRVQELCVADELAGAAELVKGNTTRVPVAIIRGVRWEPDDQASIQPVIRESSRDLFR